MMQSDPYASAAAVVRRAIDRASLPADIRSKILATISFGGRTLDGRPESIAPSLG